MSPPLVVVDTNVFVAAGFSPRSASAKILSAIRAGRLRMAWNEDTRRETQYIVSKIPRLSWRDAAEHFRDEDRFDGETNPAAFAHIPDPDDRKFAALAQAAGAGLVTNDEHLLGSCERADVAVLTPREFWKRTGDA